MTGASAATGLRTWLQTRGYSWLTPRRVRALTVAAMCGATLYASVGFSGATPPTANRPDPATPPTQTLER
jgi:hypothetical protein